MLRFALLFMTSSAVFAGGEYHKVEVPASDKPGDCTIPCTFTLWLPANGKTVRGVIVHQHGCGAGACASGETAATDLHWQALASKWDCALLSPRFHQKESDKCNLWCDPRLGSRGSFLKALDQFATLAKHPEIKSVPWCLWGHSGGGVWSSLMMASDTDRVVAAWLRSGTGFGREDYVAPNQSEALYGIPVLHNPGAKEKGDMRFNGAYTGGEKMLVAFRARNAPFAFCPDPLSSHDCGGSRFLAIPWFDACLAARLPEQGSKMQKLKTIDLKTGWLAEPLTDTVSKYAVYKDDVSKAIWLPNESVAAVYKQYVKTGTVKDTTPPEAPLAVTCTPCSNGDELRWDAVADFESGVGQFIIERNGTEIGRVPEKPVTKAGMIHFQGLSYHDTPEKTAPAMIFIDKSAMIDVKPAYRVIAVNGAGLKSKPSEPATKK